MSTTTCTSFTADTDTDVIIAPGETWRLLNKRNWIVEIIKTTTVGSTTVRVKKGYTLKKV